MQISISILVANANQGISYVKRLVKNFKARVLSYPNSIFEAEPCLVATLTELNDIELLRKSSLVITPNAYNEGVLYDVIPNTQLGDMDVVRATTATRVNSSGLIEVVPRNLLSYSQQFNNVYWNKINLSIVPDSITAPNGTLTASTYIPTASPSQLTVNTILKQTANITYTFSFYIKSAGLTDIRCFIWGSTNTNRGEATFNVVNGSVSAIGSVGGFSNTSATINLVNNGYYLCTITTTSDTSAGVNVNFRYDNTISGASGFYIWGAQLEEGSTATEYFPTTTRLNIPRIDYTNGSCPSLLVEPQRTNIALNTDGNLSTYFNVNVTNASSSFNSFVNAIQFPNTGLSIAYKSTVTTAQVYAISVFVKMDDNSVPILSASQTTGNMCLVIAGAIVTNNLKVESYGNNVYRLSGTATSAATNINNGVIRYDTQVLKPFKITGIQLEAGAYPTSYIPTVASSVTRNADLISKTGISSLIGQTEGTVFFDGKLNDSLATTKMIFQLTDGTDNNRIQLSSFSTTLFMFIIKNNVIQLNTSYALPNFSNNNKIAFVYSENNFELFVNGVLVSTNTTLSIPNTSVLNIGSYSVFGQNNFLNINSLQLYKTALTDEQSALLTGDLYNSYAEMANSLNYILE
jgi:hypothetical protein